MYMQSLHIQVPMTTCNVHTHTLTCYSDKEVEHIEEGDVKDRPPHQRHHTVNIDQLKHKQVAKCQEQGAVVARETE